MSEGIVERLRNYATCHDGDIDEAANMLEFFFEVMRSDTPKMDGTRKYRFISSGCWPLNRCVGINAEEAVLNAYKEMKKESTDGQTISTGSPASTDQQPQRGTGTEMV